jgi:hypothetical protein
LRERLELVGVYRDRVRAHPNLAVPVKNHTLLLLRLDLEHFVGRPNEVPGIATGVEADDVGLKETPQDIFPDVLRQNTPVVGLGPGDVGKEGDKSVASKAFPEKERNHVELIVVDEDHGLLSFLR